MGWMLRWMSPVLALSGPTETICCLSPFGAKRTWASDCLPITIDEYAPTRPPRRNSFATIDTGRRPRHRPDGGSQLACNAQRDHRNASARNAKQGPASSENRQQIGVAPVHPCTCALKRDELLRAAR